MRIPMKQTQVTRRRFVTAAAAGLGATAAPALLRAQDKKPIRIGGSMSMTGRYSRRGNKTSRLRYCHMLLPTRQ
jgi:hypothetical protein